MTPRSRSFAMICVVLFAALAGCESRRTAADVDPFFARDTLERVLTGWKDGAKPDDFSKENPAVVVQDIEWQRGVKLESYQLLSPGDPLDANLHCPVRLVTRDTAGKETTQDVIYIVGTDPVLTVFRKIFSTLSKRPEL